MVLSLVLFGYSVEAPWVVVLLAAVAAVAERATVRLSSNLEESISLLPTLFAAVQFGPLEAMIVAAGSMLWDHPSRPGRGRAVQEVGCLHI